MTYANFKRGLYPDQRPNWLAKILNRMWAIIHATGIARNWLVTLDVMGRKSGQIVSLPLVMVTVEGQRYLVSMLGEGAQWVLNVRAASGKAALRHGSYEQIQLEEVAVNQRAPILKVYLQRAPGARPHFPVNKDAPLAEFETIAAEFPVFRVVAKTTS